MKKLGQIAIVGAGVMGLQLAYACRDLGCEISVFEKLPEASYQSSTGFAAAGMLAPYSELESAEPLIATLGQRSLELWPTLIESLGASVYFQQRGSLLVSHSRDWPYFEQLTSRISSQAPAGAWQWVTPKTQQPAWEGAQSFSRGLYLPGEAHVDTRSLLLALRRSLEARGVRFFFGQDLQGVGPFCLVSEAGEQRFDLVCDCRGIGGAGALPSLRGVRGEAFLVEAPAVAIESPLRLMHPRYAVYIVPRADSIYYLGATSIESESLDPVTLRSSLELLSAAFSVDKGFAEARVLEAVRGIRPAFPHHRPEIQVSEGLLRINGLYRHGFLLSPLLAEQVRLYLEDRRTELVPSLFHYV